MYSSYAKGQQYSANKSPFRSQFIINESYRDRVEAPAIWPPPAAAPFRASRAPIAAARAAPPPAAAPSSGATSSRRVMYCTGTVPIRTVLRNIASVDR